MTPTRRRFIQIVPLAGAALLVSRHASAAPLVDVNDPQAKALGYVGDASKADKAKFKQYAPGQNCTNCALYQGGTAAQGGCALFPGKDVLGAGWCSAYAKKA